MKLDPVHLVAAVLLAVLPLGCRSSTDPESESPAMTAKVSGEATYLARIAPPPQAVLTVRLEDVSSADAPAVVLGEQVIELAGRQVPIPFEIRYDPARIDARHRYVVRASVHADGRRLFTSAQPPAVLTQGHPASVEVRMQPASSTPPAAAAHPLRDTHWKLTELNGAPVTAASGPSDPHLVLELEGERFSASTGVNRLSGTYSLEGDELTLRPGPMTQMAGSPAAMAQERAFCDALTRVTSFRVSGEELTLRAGTTVVLKFRAAPARS